MAHILRETHENGIEIWTLNRPEKRNSLSIELFAELRALVRAVDEEVRAIVLTGAGSVFCAGLDLSVLRSLPPEVIEEFCESSAEAYIDLYTCPAPTIAAVHGAALAGGFDLAAMCDLRVSSPGAKFGQLEARLGLPGLTEPHWRIMGLGRAKESIYTAAIYDGREAHRIGMVNRLADDPLAEALKMAGTIARNGAEAVRADKRTAAGRSSQEVILGIRDQMSCFRDFLKTPQAAKNIATYIQSLQA
jgi:enoyl-CoA hydratase/carnithine racemase